MSSLRPLWENFSYFSHQEDGIRWMLEKETNGTEVATRDGKGTVVFRGGFQCDDMGLGKTIQVAAAIANNKKKATLLIAPLAMIETWSSVCIRAGMSVFEVDSKQSKNGKQGRPWKCMNPMDAVPMHFIKNRPTVYISNYEKLYNSEHLFEREWDRVVLDEAHKIRNGDGQIARSARKIKAPIRWAVSGTPLVNSLKDVVSLLAFVGVPYSPLWRWEPRFNTILPQILLHRSLDSLRSIIKGAPPVPVIHEDVLPFTTEEEEEFYHGVQGLDDEMLRKYQHELLSNVESFKLLLRLRQISVHPQVYINAKRRESELYQRKDWATASTKMEKVKEIMQSDKEGVHKYIVFCQFNEEMALFHDFLVAEKLAKSENVLMYHGGMNQNERTAVLAKSKETTETTVLLLQLQAGGVGLNLQEYDRVIFVSPWWTAALMDQAIARAVRMGQTQVVHVYHLRLASEHKTAIQIDTLINQKAEEKRKMLIKLFEICKA